MSSAASLCSSRRPSRVSLTLAFTLQASCVSAVALSSSAAVFLSMTASASDRVWGPIQMKKFWLEFWLEKSLEFWPEILLHCTKKMFINW